MRQLQHEKNKFLAAIQGIDLDKGKSSNDAVERARRSAAAKLAGGEGKLQKEEFADLGFGYESV